MAERAIQASYCPKSAEVDFIHTLNSQPGGLIELAFASPGTSQFNRALYLEALHETQLTEVASQRRNVSFAGGFSPAAMEPMVLGTEIQRKGADRYVIYKKIITFDLDFKDNHENYDPSHRDFLIEKLGSQIQEGCLQNQMPLWMLVFSGNGLHLHFKLQEVYKLTSVQQYKHMYDGCRAYLECQLGVKLDPACSNPSRLIRLPFSSNWKDNDHPVPCRVLYHQAEANFSPTWSSFQQLVHFTPRTDRKNKRDRDAILAALDLRKILAHFGYGKASSIQEKNGQVLCSSPFREDSTPSFYYQPQKKLFFDFSAGFGGDLFTLIGQLAHLDPKSEFGKILSLAASIAGIQNPSTASPGFFVNDKGVWHQAAQDADPIWLASPIFIDALTRDSGSEAWGRLLTFTDQDQITKSWSMPMDLLSGDGSEIRRNLLHLGVEMAIGKRERILFLSYLQSTKPSQRAQCVQRIGWHQGQFVLPNRVIATSDNATHLILQTSHKDMSFGVSGSLETWQEHIGQACRGNSRLIFAVSTAFASVFLKETGEESGGFHFVGASSIGKSITLKVAASVWGSPGLNGFIKRWRSTLNGLELVAASRCDSLLLLDELGEIKPEDAGNAAYMLSGGVSKNRATKHSTLAAQFEWRLLFLSSGEITLASHMAQNGTTTHVGQEVRMIDVPAESSGSQGIFENIHGFSTSGEFARELSEQAEKYFGTPILLFLDLLVKMPSLIEKLYEYRKEFESRAGQNLHGQVHRAVKRFSLVAAAGELAIEVGVLPWEKGEAHEGVEKCFQEWLAAWGPSTSKESQHLIQRIQSLLQEFGSSRFPILQEFRQSHTQYCQHLWGFRSKAKKYGYDWVILSEIFRTHFCEGKDYRQALQELKEHKLLLTAPGPMRVPHLGVTRVIQIRGNIFNI